MTLQEEYEEMSRVPGHGKYEKMHSVAARMTNKEINDYLPFARRRVQGDTKLLGKQGEVEKAPFVRILTKMLEDRADGLKKEPAQTT